MSRLWRYCFSFINTIVVPIYVCSKQNMISAELRCSRYLHLINIYIK